MREALRYIMGYANGGQTHIGVHEDTKSRLSTLKEADGKSYDQLLNELADQYKKD
jgi:hypothetical protein